MIRTFVTIFALLVLVAAAENSVQGEELVQPISLEGVELINGGERGRATEPKSATSHKELIKLIGEAGAKTLSDKIDFETHDFILFRWAGSGQDKVTAKEDGDSVVFLYKRGLTRDLRPHRAAFVVKKKTAWSVKIAPFGRGR